MRRRPLAAAVVGAAFVLTPALLLVGALHAPGTPPPRGFDLLVPEPDLGAFTRAFELIDLERQLVNSLIVALVAVPLTVLVASWAGFATTRLSPRWRRAVIAGSLAALIVPLSALWVPRFVLFSELSLIDTYLPLWLPAATATSPLYVLLFYWSYRRLPPDLVDSARLAGLGTFAVWRQVAAPLVRPTTFAVAALAFAFHWGNFVDPLLYLNDPDLLTAPLGLRQLRDLGPTDFPVLLAAALVVTLPAAVAFGLVQRRFLSDTRAAGWFGR